MVSTKQTNQIKTHPLSLTNRETIKMKKGNHKHSHYTLDGKGKKMSEAKRTEYYHFIYFADTHAMREKVERDRKGEHGENL